MAVESPTSVTNKGELVEYIRYLINRSDQDDAIEVWIDLFEDEVNNYEVVVNPQLGVTEPFRHRKMIKTEEDLQAATDNPLIALPSDFLEMITFTVAGNEMRYKPPNVLDYQRDTITTLPTSPCDYSYEGDYIEVWPTPTEDLTTKLEYYATLTALSGATSTNWLLTLAPTAYCYGVAKHSAPVLRDDARIALWARLADDRLTALHHSNKKAAISGSRLNIPQTTTF